MAWLSLGDKGAVAGEMFCLESEKVSAYKLPPSASLTLAPTSTLQKSFWASVTKEARLNQDVEGREKRSKADTAEGGALESQNMGSSPSSAFY